VLDLLDFKHKKREELPSQFVRLIGLLNHIDNQLVTDGAIFGFHRIFTNSLSVGVLFPLAWGCVLIR
jgi:hypothetical protein